MGARDRKRMRQHERRASLSLHDGPARSRVAARSPRRSECTEDRADGAAKGKAGAIEEAFCILGRGRGADRERELQRRQSANQEGLSDPPVSLCGVVGGNVSSGRKVSYPGRLGRDRSPRHTRRSWRAHARSSSRTAPTWRVGQGHRLQRGSGPRPVPCKPRFCHSTFSFCPGCFVRAAVGAALY
jgi:hypothetical protein